MPRGAPDELGPALVSGALEHHCPLRGLAVGGLAVVPGSVVMELLLACAVTAIALWVLRPCFKNQPPKNDNDE